MGVDVFVYQDRVTIDFTGLDRFLVLKAHLDLSMYDITGVRVMPTEEARKDVHWRTLGAYWPGVVATGYYTVRTRTGVRQLWCVYRDPEVLVIDTRLDNPCRVVLQHPDRHDLAWLIGERLPHYT